jgi:hypothetical protein
MFRVTNSREEGANDKGALGKVAIAYSADDLGLPLFFSERSKSEPL